MVLRNCTAAEAQEHITGKYGAPCQEGGFCRLIEPSTFYCECLGRWVGQLCNEPDFFPAHGVTPAITSVYLPLVGIILLLLIVAAVLVAYFGLRWRRAVGLNDEGSDGGGRGGGFGAC